MKGGPRATVAIPTFNGEHYLREVLDAIFDQAEVDFEVLVIDSGSTDSTLKILEEYPVRLIEIPNEEFGHGRTRNFAVQQSAGDYVAFLTQDATPAGEHWLYHFVRCLDEHPDVGAAYGPHLPRPDADPKTKRELVDFFGGMGPPDRPTLHRAGDITFLSDVNACLRKEVWRKIPYRDLDYAEDQAFGRDILEAGFAKAFEPRAAVVHSHSYGLRDYFRRQYDEWIGLKMALGATDTRSIARVFGGASRDSLVDARYIWHQADGGPLRRLSWIARTAWMNLSKRLAPYLAEREASLPKRLVVRLSYERSRARARRRREAASDGSPN